MENYQAVWDEVVNQLKFHITPQSFEMAFSSPQQAYKEDNKVYVTTTNDSEQFLIEKFHIPNISKTLTEVTGLELDIKFVTPEFIEKQMKSFSLTEADTNVHHYYRGDANLNASYTFDRYVAGKSNRLAYMIGLQVADRPGEVANPLYLFGGVGLGKTHLMQAIGNQMLDNNLNTRILYCTSEKFIDDYRTASIDNTFDIFKQKYRDIDVLLIDDIQFLAKKEQTQEEFFNTFNDLYNENKQIVISSDRPASELKDMMDRLTSRFEWGMQADIQIPDLQTRMDIIKKKLSGENYNPDEFPADVLDFVASKFTKNVRTLEGALKRLIFFATMQQAEITIELANDALKHLIKKERNTSNIDTTKILKEVSDYYNITPGDIISKSRKKEIALARQVAIYLMRECTGESYPKIGDAFGGRDHTTIMHSCNKIEKAVAKKSEIANDVRSLKKLLL